MSVLFVLSALLLSGCAFMAILNWATAFRLEKAPLLLEKPKVSLLIPLRNESSRIRTLLTHLKNLTYPFLEIILLNDESTDNTGILLEKLADPSFKWVNGKPLPQGWVGKSWACFQLSQIATGELFLFCDADVEMSPKSVERTVAWIQAQKTDAVTVLPFQQMETFWEKAVIPFVMHLPILGLVPLRWVARIKNKNLVVANGQWFGIQKKAYEKIKGHESVKNSLLEDMDLAKNLVKSGSAVLPVIGVQDLKVRMYRSWGEILEGFTKNLFYLAGGSVGGVSLVFCFCLILYLVPLTSVFLLGGLVVLRIICFHTFKSPWETLLFHPMGAIAFLGILIRSSLAHYRKKIVWRGREVIPT